MVLVGDESGYSACSVPRAICAKPDLIIPWDEALHVRYRGPIRGQSPSVEVPALTPQRVGESLSAISPDDTAILICTSGDDWAAQGRDADAPETCWRCSGTTKGFGGFFADDLTIGFLMAHSAEILVLSFYGAGVDRRGLAFASKARPPA